MKTASGIVIAGPVIAGTAAAVSAVRRNRPQRLLTIGVGTWLAALILSSFSSTAPALAQGLAVLMMTAALLSPAGLDLAATLSTVTKL